jgi:hypothetical protein
MKVGKKKKKQNPSIFLANYWNLSWKSDNLRTVFFKIWWIRAIFPLKNPLYRLKSYYTVIYPLVYQGNGFTHLTLVKMIVGRQKYNNTLSTTTKPSRLDNFLKGNLWQNITFLKSVHFWEFSTQKRPLSKRLLPSIHNHPPIQPKLNFVKRLNSQILKFLHSLWKFSAFQKLVVHH